MNTLAIFAHVVVTLTLRVITPEKIRMTLNAGSCTGDFPDGDRIRAARDLHACQEIEVLGVARKITEKKPEYQRDQAQILAHFVAQEL